MSDTNMGDQPQVNAQGQAVMIEQLRAQIAQPSQLVSAHVTTPHPPMKKKLPDPERYDGEDKAKYPSFETNLEAKIALDGNILGSRANQVWYAYGRLTGRASELLQPWIQKHKDTPWFTVSSFIEQMRATFQDPELGRRALDKLGSMRQGKQGLREFLADFDRTLLEARGASWDDDVKIDYLRRALSQDLIETLVTVDEPTEYAAFCSKIKWLEQKKDSAQARREQQQQSAPTTRPLPYKPEQPARCHGLGTHVVETPPAPGPMG